MLVMVSAALILLVSRPFALIWQGDPDMTRDKDFDEQLSKVLGSDR